MGHELQPRAAPLEWKLNKICLRKDKFLKLQNFVSVEQ